MKKWLLAILLVPVLASCSNLKLSAPGKVDKADADSPEFNKGKEVVKIGSTSIHEGLLDFLAKINPRVKAQLTNPQMRKQVLGSLVDQEILYQASLKQGLGNDPDIGLKTAFYKRSVIAQALLEQELTKKSQQYYNDKKETEFTKVQISDIEVKINKPAEAAPADGSAPAPADPKGTALQKAKDIKAKITAGEDFAKLAGELSDDAVTKKRGGDMGTISREDKRLVRRNLQAIGQAAFTLKKGEVSDPIEAGDSYHIIKVTSDPQVTPFEEADRVIRFQIQKDVHDELLASLKKEFAVTYTDPADAPSAGGTGSADEENPAAGGMPAAHGAMPPGATPPAADQAAPKADVPAPATGPAPAGTPPAPVAAPAAPAAVAPTPPPPPPAPEATGPATPPPAPAHP